jgi:hypothetical protein
MDLQLLAQCQFRLKVVHPLVKFWRSKGFLIVVYLDDGLGFEDSEESCVNVSIEALSDLLSAGFFYQTIIYLNKRIPRGSLVDIMM